MVVALWLCGFLSAFYALPIADSLQTGLAVSGLLVSLAFVFSSPDIKLPATLLTWLIGGLWALAAASFIGSDVKFVSLLFLYFFSALPLGFAIVSLSGQERNFLLVIRLVLLVLGVSTLVQYYFMPDMLKFGGTHWPFADNNSLGAALAAGALLHWGQFLRGTQQDKQQSRQNQIFFFLATMMFFAGVISTGGRAITLICFFMTGLLTFVSRGATVPWRQMGMFLAGVFILLLAMPSSEFGFSHLLDNGTKAVESFEETPTDRPNLLSGSRFMMWESAFQIFKDHPVFGTGIGTFYTYYPEYRNPYDDSAGYMAHNDVLQFASDMGFMAPILVLLISGFMIWKTFLVLRKQNVMDKRLDIAIPFSVFGCMAVHSLVNFNFYILPSLMINGVMLAVWNKQVATSHLAIGISRKKIREMVMVFGCMAVLVPLWGVSVSEYKTSEAIKALEQRDIQKFSDDLNIAEMAGWGLNGRVYLQAGTFAAATNDKNRAMYFLDKAEKVNPRMAQLYVERSRLNEKEGQMDKALSDARTGLQMNPASLPARMQYADILESMGKKPEAYAVLKDGLVGRMRNPSPGDFYKRTLFMANKFHDMATREICVERLEKLQD